MIAWLRRRFGYRHRIKRLRAALADACQGCERCCGDGKIAIAGGTVSCPVCGRWRRVLKETA